MKLSFRNVALGLSAVLGLLGLMTGCAPTQTATETQVAAPAAPTHDRFQERVGDISYSWQGFPQNVTRPEDALVLVEREVPTEIRPNQDVRYVIRITNQSNFTVDQIVHEEVVSDSLKFTGADPYPEERDGKLVWTIDGFGPGQSRTMTVEGTAVRTGSMRYSGNTGLGFGLGSLALAATSIQADLTLAVNNPAVSLIEEPIPVSVSLRNSGTAPIEDARLVHTFPRGLLTVDGRSRIELNLGNFAPGEVKSVDIELKGVETGRYETQLRATAKDGISAVATLQTSIVKPELVITADAPRLRYVGNVIPYNIEVKNTGDGVARNVSVVQVIADGTTLASVDQGGMSEGRNVTWDLGVLNPGQSRVVSSRVVGERIMIVRSTTTATALSASPVSTVMVTDVEGIEALLVEVEDDNDPVPLGDYITYTITVNNQGSLEATGVRVKSNMTREMEFVESGGATKSRIEGNQILFDVLPSLAPRATATWTVMIKAVAEGDLRFVTEVTSDQLERPVRVEESSTFYE